MPGHRHSQEMDTLTLPYGSTEYALNKQYVRSSFCRALKQHKKKKHSYSSIKTCTKSYMPCTGNYVDLFISTHMHFILAMPMHFPLLSYTDVPKSYAHDFTLSAELKMNGTVHVCYFIAIRNMQMVSYSIINVDNCMTIYNTIR